MIAEIMKKKQETWNKFTKYEIARILGARALQLAMNAPMLLKLDKEQLEQLSYDPLRIAELELYSGVLPITVKRPLPVRKQEMEIKVELKVETKEEEKGIKKKEKEKGKEEVKEKVVKVEKSKEEQVKEEEKRGEAAIKEIAEGAEIMELAKPEDEMEEVSEASEAEAE